MAPASFSSSSLDLTISVQSFSLSPPIQPSSVMRDVVDHELTDRCNIIDGGQRKKLRLTKEQSCLLEDSFRHNHTLNTKQKEALAMQLKLRPRQVEVWFQNRRARSKLKQTEMECEYLKRWFGSLTEQNRRLQREVEELRALKVVGSPSHISTSDVPPPSSLTMCPRCERVSSTSHLLLRPPDNKSSPPNTLSSNPSTSP